MQGKIYSTPKGDIRGKEFLPRDCAQKLVPPKAWRFCATLVIG